MKKLIPIIAVCFCASTVFCLFYGFLQLFPNNSENQEEVILPDSLDIPIVLVDGVENDNGFFLPLKPTDFASMTVYTYPDVPEIFWPRKYRLFMFETKEKNNVERPDTVYIVDGIDVCNYGLSWISDIKSVTIEKDPKVRKLFYPRVGPVLRITTWSKKLLRELMENHEISKQIEKERAAGVLPDE